MSAKLWLASWGLAAATLTAGAHKGTMSFIDACSDINHAYAADKIELQRASSEDTRRQFPLFSEIVTAYAEAAGEKGLWGLSAMTGLLFATVSIGGAYTLKRGTGVVHSKASTQSGLGLI